VVRAPARGRRLLIVWWSNTGGTASLVSAAADGARQAVLAAARDGAGRAVPAADVAPGGDAFEVLACRCDLVAPPALLAADALMFATPECLGSMAGPMKAFFDRCYYPALDLLTSRPYATMVCAGTDGHGAIRQIDRIATGWRLRRIAEPLLAITGAQTPDAIAAPKSVPEADCARAGELGATLAAGTLLGVW
jgi:multimeric flavodoxin WrbA